MIDLPRLAQRLVERRLSNGLRLVMLPDPSSALVAVNLWYHVGSKNDPRGRSGLAHLFEHMLFQGSLHVEANEHFRLVQQFGGVTNASTSFDRTNYYETLPAHCLELGLWLESDRLGFLLPALTEEKFEGQRSVVINERRQRIDNQPYGRAFETILGTLFPNSHPYSWPIIGHLEDIEAATLDDVETFFRTHYRPSTAVLSLVGNFDPPRAEALVRDYFANIPSPADTEERRPSPPESTRPFAGEEILLEDEVALPRTYLAWRTAELTHSDRYAGEVLAATLTGGKSSPLYQDLVYERRVAQDVSAFMLPLELGSVFFIVATARPEIELQQLECEISRHLSRARSEPPSEGDIERARNQVTTGLFEQMQSMENLADLLSRAATLLGSPAEIDNEAPNYLSQSAHDLQAFAADYLRLENALTVRVIPRPEEASE